VWGKILVLFVNEMMTDDDTISSFVDHRSSVGQQLKNYPTDLPRPTVRAGYDDGRVKFGLVWFGFSVCCPSCVVVIRLSEATVRGWWCGLKPKVFF